MISHLYRFKFGMILGVVFCLCTLGQSHFYTEHAKGWHWYEVTPIQDEQQAQTPEMQIQNIRSELDQLRQAAWIEPTEQRLIAYLKAQQAMFQKNQEFAQSWQKVVMHHPELDHSTRFPVNQAGRHEYEKKLKALITKRLKNLAKSHGLFYFFKSDCNYCHAMHATVKHFSESLDWPLLAISLDGQPTADFPEAKLDQGQAKALNITVVPSLLAICPQTKAVLPLAFGLTAESEIFERIGVLLDLNQEVLDAT